jgi:hypothetical protein
MIADMLVIALVCETFRSHSRKCVNSTAKNGSPPLARIPNARIHLEELSRMGDGRKTLPERNCQNKIVGIGFRPNFFRKMHEIIDTQFTSKVELYFTKMHAFLHLFP